MSRLITPLIAVVILFSACANADTETIHTIVPTETATQLPSTDTPKPTGTDTPLPPTEAPTETATHLPSTDTPKPTETATPLPPTDSPEPTVTATKRQSPTPEIKSERIQVSYEDRVLRGTLVGEGEIVVILAPGFDETRGVWMKFARHIASMGYTALAFDFPGFGASTGSYSFAKLKPDVTALIDYLQQERAYERIVCMGNRIGGGACFEAAKDVPILAGLVIISSPMNTTTAEEVAELSMPKLMVIGTEPDEAHEDVNGAMREIYDLLPDPKQFESIRQRGSTLLTSGDELQVLLVEFLESLE